MGFGYLYFDFGESGGDFLCQYRHNGVFRVEMAGIDLVHAQITGIPDLVVLHI